MALYLLCGSRWQKEPSGEVNTGEDVVTAAPDRFSLWAVQGEIDRVSLAVVMRQRKGLDLRGCEPSSLLRR